MLGHLTEETEAAEQQRFRRARAGVPWTGHAIAGKLAQMDGILGTTLVGREEQLEFLVAALNGARSHGRAIALVGDPGVGKSALQSKVAEHARSLGFTVLMARGSPSETHLPYASLHQVLRPVLSRAERLPRRLRDALLGCFAMNDSVEANPFHTVLAVLELVADAAQQAPLLVCLDDVQWMDQSSLEALAFVARRIAGEQVVVLGAARQDLLRFVDESPFERVSLEGISAEAAATLLASRAPGLPTSLRERVLQDANGNPLALLEFANALESGWDGWLGPGEDLPMTTRLERAFAARAERLEPGARAVVTVAAVDDGDAIHDVFAAAEILHGAPIDQVAAMAALDGGLLIQMGDTYRIAHPLVGSALRQIMPLPTRRAAHRALASVLSTQPSRALWHRASSVSGPDETVAAELETAASHARRRGAVTSAVGWLGRAAELSPEPESQASRLLSAAELAYELGRFTQVERFKSQVRDLPLRARDRSRLTWLEGVFHDGSTGAPGEVLHLVDLARRATRDQDPDLAMQLLVGAARRVWWRDPGESTRQEIVRAVREVDVPMHDPRLLAVYGVSDSLQLGAVVGEQLARWPDDAHGRPDAAGLLGIAAFCTGNFGSAVRFLSTPVQALRDQGRMSLLAEALAIRAWAEIYLGVFDAASSADEAMRLADETGQSLWAATARIAVALIDAVHGGGGAHTGLLVEAERTAQRTPNAMSSLVAAAQLARGVAELNANRHEQAYAELHRVFVPADPAWQRVQQVWTLSYLADAAVHTGRRAEATSLLGTVGQLAAGSPAEGTMIALEYTRALLADTDSAEPLFQGAIEGAARELPWHRARAELAYGSWLRRQRRVLESRAPLRAARRTFDAVGAHAWAQHADGELRATGERGWRPAANPREVLSPQEIQIAELAAKGLSNREIGEQLFLSHRTVSSHLYRIFPKLDITGRGQLAGALSPGSEQLSPPGPAVI